MAVLVNSKDCDNAVKNLGVPECILSNGRITGMIAVSPDWSIDISSDTFNQAAINDLIQEHTFIPILGAVEVLNNTPEATTEEYQGGIMAVVRNGLPYFAFKFLKGWAYARALYTMNSFQAYKLLLVFEDGSIAGALNGTTFTGYSLGMLNTGTYFHTDGAVSGNVTTLVQLTNSDEYNKFTGVIDRSVLGFDANTLMPITDIVITGRADVSNDKIYIKPVFEMNGAQILMGIATTKLRITIDGTSTTVSTCVYEPSTKEWEIEVGDAFTTSSRIVVQLYDSVNTVAVAKIGSKYYEGVTAQITPVA